MPVLNLSEILDESRLSYIILNKKGFLVYANSPSKQILNDLNIYKSDNVLKKLQEIFPKISLNDLLNESKIITYLENSTIFDFEVYAYEKYIDNSLYYVFNMYDITKYNSQIIDNSIYKIIFNSAASAIVVTDSSGSIEKVNPSFEKLTGYSLDEAKGKNPKILKSGYHSDKFFKEMWETLSKGETWRGNIRDKLKNGEFIWEKSVISPIKDDAGNITKYVAVKENITKEMAQEEELKKLSYQDYLTGLYNRRKFIEYTEELMDFSLENDLNLFCLMIDVDNFKSVNDTYGHEVGDKVLIEIAKILNLNVRSRDIASRYGGEEFIVILSRYSYEQALLRSEKIRDDISKAQVVTNQNNISVTVSIGFCEFDTKSSLSDWIQMSDKALYKAKQTGKNKVCEYSKIDE